MEVVYVNILYSLLILTQFCVGGPLALLTVPLLAGPGHYNIFNTGMAQESLKRAYLESTRHGPFGTTSARIMPILQKHDVALPGPSHYQVS